MRAKIAGKSARQSSACVVNGAGAAAIACARLFIAVGVRRENMVFCDSQRRGHRPTARIINEIKREFATTRRITTLAEAIHGADVFLGRIEGRRADPRNAAHDGDQPDRHGAGQSRPGNRLRQSRRFASRHHLRDGTLGLPQPGKQRAGLPLHFPRGARRTGHEDQRSDEARRGTRAWPNWPRSRYRHGTARLCAGQNSNSAATT